MVSALDAAKSAGREVKYVKGFSVDQIDTEEAELEKALSAAKEADAVVIFAGLPESFESEGYDRADLKMPACQDEVISAVAKVNSRVAVVLHNGSVVETPWADEVGAVLELYLGGQGVGTAADRLLYGDANPSGHLAESFPIKLEDNPSYLFFPGSTKKVHYAEGIYVGYRYYDKKEMPVRWAFGHGLSYTDFAIGNISLSTSRMDDDSKVTVSIDVTNTGSVMGKDVVQLYISDKTGSVDRPKKELKGFEKVSLQPGETKQVSMEIDARSLSYWSEELGDWFAASGTYEVLVGDASDNISAMAEIQFTTRKKLPMPISGDTTFGELMEDSRTAPVVAQMLQAMGSAMGGADGMGDGGDEMMRRMVEFMPIKSLLSFSGAEKAEQLMEALKAAVNQ